MSASDVVFVLPGFLGFERTGNFTHFADRMVTALRGTIDSQLGRAVPVVPIAELPARSLVARQRVLLKVLARHVEALGGAERIHLVGYSLGGLDAHLLTCTHPLEAGRWDEVCSSEANAVRGRIASVISIASPHLGTCLASAKGAGSLTPKRVLRDPAGALHAAKLLPKLVASAWSSIDSDDLWHGFAREGRKVAHFVAELRRYQGILQELTPAAMVQLQEGAEPAPGVRRASVVTLTPSLDEGSDTLFAELSKHAAGGSTMSHGSLDPLLFRACEAIRAALVDPTRIIRSPRARLPSKLDITVNDGVVNSCRQLILPHGAHELLAVVVGDHFDVVGYYDRRHELVGHEREVSSGLLRSGSFFRDDEFFALYRKVGQYIAETVEQHEPRAEPVRAESDMLESSSTQAKAKTKRSRSSKPRDITP